ncbi:MAG: hypothetical protein U0470_02415 [Anaerolineae bacterium]
MDIALIDERVVREALHAIRYAHPLAGSRLTGLAAVTARLARDGIADSPSGREWALASLLDDAIRASLAAARPEGSAEPDDGRRRATALAQARADFRVGDATLEAWSVLRYRYVAPSPLQMREMADELGVGERTLRRRLNQGHELLAAVLREHEVSAARQQGASGEGRSPRPAVLREALPRTCPYRGLRAFRAGDAGFFFGRETF